MSHALFYAVIVNPVKPKRSTCFTRENTEVLRVGVEGLSLLSGPCCYGLCSHAPPVVAHHIRVSPWLAHPPPGPAYTPAPSSQPALPWRRPSTALDSQQTPSILVPESARHASSQGEVGSCLPSLKPTHSPHYSQHLTQTDRAHTLSCFQFQTLGLQRLVPSLKYPSVLERWVGTLGVWPWC